MGDGASEHAKLTCPACGTEWSQDSPDDDQTDAGSTDLCPNCRQLWPDSNGDDASDSGVQSEVDPDESVPKAAIVDPPEKKPAESAVLKTAHSSESGDGPRVPGMGASQPREGSSDSVRSTMMGVGPDLPAIERDDREADDASGDDGEGDTEGDTEGKEAGEDKKADSSRLRNRARRSKESTNRTTASLGRSPSHAFGPDADEDEESDTSEETPEGATEADDADGPSETSDGNGSSRSFARAKERADASASRDVHDRKTSIATESLAERDISEPLPAGDEPDRDETEPSDPTDPPKDPADSDLRDTDDISGEEVARKLRDTDDIGDTDLAEKLRDTDDISAAAVQKLRDNAETQEDAEPEQLRETAEMEDSEGAESGFNIPAPPSAITKKPDFASEDAPAEDAKDDGSAPSTDDASVPPPQPDSSTDERENGPRVERPQQERPQEQRPQTDDAGAGEATGDESTSEGEVGDRPSLGQRLARLRDGRDSVDPDTELEAEDPAESGVSKKDGSTEDREEFPTLGEDTNEAIEEAVESTEDEDENEEEPAPPDADESNAETMSLSIPDPDSLERQEDPPREGPISVPDIPIQAAADEADAANDEQKPSEPVPTTKQTPDRTSDSASDVPADKTLEIPSPERVSSSETESPSTPQPPPEDRSAPDRSEPESTEAPDSPLGADSPPPGLQKDDGATAESPPPESKSPNRDAPETAAPETDTSPPEDPAQPASGNDSGSSGGLLLGLAVLLVGGLGLAGYMIVGGSGDTPGDSSSAEKKKKGRAAQKKAERARKRRQKQQKRRRAAVEAARETLHSAAAVDVDDPELQRAVADRLLEDGRPRRSARIYDSLWRHHRRGDASFARRYLDVLMRAEMFDRARRVALASLTTADAAGETDETAAFRKAYRRSVRKDPDLKDAQIAHLGELLPKGTLKPAAKTDVGRGLVLAGPEGTPRFVFSPETEWRQNWRDDVAAWRLCELLGCRFEIPRTRPVKVRRSTFETMADGLEGLENSGALDVSELRWSREKGPDGDRHDYLYGSLRRWPGPVVRWPIEDFDTWRPWMRAAEDPAVLEAAPGEALSAFRKLNDGTLYDRILRETPQSTLRPVAAQLSDVLVFDYLTNNWGRFQDDETDYGAANHFADGRFVTLRTDTVFQVRHSRRVKGRFTWNGRFNRDTVTALRLLDRDLATRILYPDPSPVEDKKLEVFWEQRKRVLERVDRLVASYGKDAVFPFERR